MPHAKSAFPRARRSAQWRRLRARVLAGATHCQMPDCRYPGVPLKHTGSRHDPLYATVDHLVPVSKTRGWTDADKEAVLLDPRYLRPAHNACNAARGNRPAAKARRTPPSRDWGVS